jgi:hypothetical protein
MSARRQSQNEIETAEFLLPTSRPVELPPLQARPEAMLAGRLVGFDAEGVPLVEWPGMREATPQPAQTTVPLGLHDIGRDVVLASLIFNDRTQPVIMGLLQKPVSLAPTFADPANGWDVISDGKRLYMAAREEITLNCGKASITLTKAGKVVIRGEYILSRSSGVNRIKGGSVQIN